MTQTIFNRRLFFRKAAESAAAVVVAAAPAPAPAAPVLAAPLVDPDQSYPGHVPADDMVPRFREVRELVDRLESSGYPPMLMHGQLHIIYPEDGVYPTPETLIARLRACDRGTVIEYLEITGRASA